VGGLPYPVLDGDAARAVVDVAERMLVTPMGLRSLSPSDPAYCPRYEGGVAQRDGAYHQGTAWPWLIGAFVDAWLRVHGDDAARRAQARARFVAPLVAHLAVAGLGHVSEIADGDAPHTPRGCPFQAWSMSELIRAPNPYGAKLTRTRSGHLAHNPAERRPSAIVGRPSNDAGAGWNGPPPATTRCRARERRLSAG